MGSLLELISSGNFNNKAFWVGAFLTAFAYYMLSHARSSLRDAEPSKMWPTVRGRIKESSIIRRVNGRKRTIWFVRYSYDVNGQSYESRRGVFYTQTNEQALACHEKFNEGEEAKVYYKPENPARSVLVPGAHKGKSNSDLILASLGLVISVAVMIAGYLGYIG